MKRLNFLIIIFVWLPCTSSQCDKEKCHKRIEFVNNSPKDIYTCTFIPRKPTDTLEFYKWFPNLARSPHQYKVKSGEKSSYALVSQRKSCFENEISVSGFVIYVFDAEVLETVPWDTVGKYYMVLRTIRPTLEEMQRNNWTITFTGE